MNGNMQISFCFRNRIVSIPHYWQLKNISLLKNAELYMLRAQSAGRNDRIGFARAMSVGDFYTLYPIPIHIYLVLKGMVGLR